MPTSLPQIRPIHFAEILAEKALLEEYAAECSIPELGPINPQAAMYEEREAVGMAQMFGAYRDGKMVGFASLLTTILPHYGCKAATLESLFISSDARASGAGSMMMAVIEGFAKQAGCVAILYSAPAGGQLERLLSLKSAYSCTSAIFCRRLI